MLRLRVITGDWEGLGFSRTAVHPDSKHEDVGHRRGLRSERPGGPAVPPLGTCAHYPPGSDAQAMMHFADGWGGRGCLV